MSISVWLNAEHLLVLSYHNRYLCRSGNHLVIGGSCKRDATLSKFLRELSQNAKINVSIKSSDLSILKNSGFRDLEKKQGGELKDVVRGRNQRGGMPPEHPDRVALKKLHGKLDSELKQYKRMDAFGGQSHLETALKWLINTAKVAIGIASVVVSMGGGGDEVVKIISAVYSTSAFVVDFVEIYMDAKEHNLYLKEIMSINFSKGPAGVESEVKLILMQMIANGHEELISDICSILVKILNAVAGVFGDWISSFIPDDAGIVGIAIQQIITALSENVFLEILDKYHMLPTEVQETMQSPPKMKQFLSDLLMTIKKLLTENNDNWSKAGIADRYLKAALHMVPVVSWFTGSYAGETLTKDILDVLQEKFKPHIPGAVKGIDIVIPMVFAILSIYKYCRGGIDQLRQEAIQLDNAGKLFPTGDLTRMPSRNVTPVSPKNVVPARNSIIVSGTPQLLKAPPMPPMTYSYDDYQKFLDSMSK